MTAPTGTSAGPLAGLAAARASSSASRIAGSKEAR
jgi:hypothetical protein